MPLKDDTFTLAPLCTGATWNCTDQTKLARLVAIVLLGYYSAAEGIIATATVGEMPKFISQVSANSFEHIIAKLTDVSSVQLRYHRDGWVFQIISWIAAQMRRKVGTHIRGPQPRTADKGLDGLTIVLNSDGSRLATVIVGEDKATESPRSTITDKVWPEFLEFDSGARDNELVSDMTAVLRASGIAGADDIIKNTTLEEIRCFRVFITVEDPIDENDLRKLFKGYDSAAKGTIDKRAGETLNAPDIRTWMDHFCAHVVSELKASRT
jgi:hypothetical protein